MTDHQTQCTGRCAFDLASRRCCIREGIDSHNMRLDRTPSGFRRSTKAQGETLLDGGAKSGKGMGPCEILKKRAPWHPSADLQVLYGQGGHNVSPDSGLRHTKKSEFELQPLTRICVKAGLVLLSEARVQSGEDHNTDQNLQCLDQRRCKIAVAKILER